MHDPIVTFVARLFQWLGRGIGFAFGIVLWPFMRFGRWLSGRGLLLKTGFGALAIVLLCLYGYFFYVTQWWTNFNPDYPVAWINAADTTAAGDPVQPAPEAQAPTNEVTAAASCKPSAIAAVSADLVDFNVNQNAWISSMLVSKLGLFGIDWRRTPFFDNKAAFQLGINQVMRRTTTELVDTLGRVRGTSQIDQNLQDARTALAWNEDAWYIGWRGPTRPTPSVYRDAIRKLRAFNASLEKCQATFDARADNLMQFLDRIASDIGSTSDILRARIEASNAGWFDMRADDRFWFAYGQLYAYYGILVATRSDFAAVIAERNLTTLWTRMQKQLRNSLDVQPWIISNGSESSSFFPSHLATMGFSLLQVRSNIVEIRSVLDR
ncbi:DUF2333 family protein [Manganibacter manganicus]|uniref:DUF2333 domain-containing protein n=1 Tax=Manganibacter manganicus TaxID=1873176 RepID=A0A1V8RUH3_9HYPH|nr:DUF2333 family protein [Pseudaminobacter manganicus]OQM76832.1 hypothetical protein BFN67_11550 [Pseudaminobacter manganicus]